ncbi:MAG: hypothetical protein ACPL7G_06000, partial [Chloroflexia bacterium]
GVPPLEEMEERVRDLVFRLGRDLLQGAVNLIGSGYQAEGPQCECGAEMEFERYQTKSVLTLFGPLSVRRAYYTCAPCHHGQAPLDDALRLDHIGLSGGLQLSVGRWGGCLLKSPSSFWPPSTTRRFRRAPPDG